MKKSIAVLCFLTHLLLGSGCVVTTSGEANWEIYAGIRTKQSSPEPASVEIQSSVVDKLMESFSDGEVSEAE